MPEPVHLALGDSAAGCLRAACASGGLPGAAIGLRDDLSHGPLDDGRRRSDYMRACYRGYSEWPGADPPDRWTPVSEYLDRAEAVSIVIWAGDNVSEATFLAKACRELSGRPGPLLRVAVPERDGAPYVALYRPAELADLYATRRELTDGERLALGNDFLRIRDETGLLRRWTRGRIVGIPPDSYDHFLLKSCPTSWLQAARLIGAAMAKCDRRNRLSDLFFSSRLQVLIGTGQIAADGVQRDMRDYTVRLPEG